MFVINVMKRIWDVIKDMFSNTFSLTIANNSNKDSSTVFQNGTINIQNGSLIQANVAPMLETKESVEEFANQMIKLFQENHLIDINNNKFQYYINQSVLILKLNDSLTKRKILKDLLLRKFGGKEQGLDDSDAPTTIALDAMRYLTDVTIKHLCAFRLLTNVIPSIINTNELSQLLSITDFIKQNGLMGQVEMMNLTRLGIIHDMSTVVYSLNGVLEYIEDDNNTISGLTNLEGSSVLSSCLSPAGMELTDIALEYFLNLRSSYEQWLPLINKSLHLKELVVDEDVTVKKNLAAYGTVASGGRAK